MSSGSFSISPPLPLIGLQLDFPCFPLSVNSLIRAYIKSVHPCFSIHSRLSHSVSHHSSNALSVVLLNSLFKALYFFLPSFVLNFFASRLSSIFSIISSVIHGFLILAVLLYPTHSTAPFCKMLFSSTHLTFGPLLLSLFSASCPSI